MICKQYNKYNNMVTPTSEDIPIILRARQLPGFVT